MLWLSPSTLLGRGVLGFLLQLRRPTFVPTTIRKYTTREPRAEVEPEVICVDEIPQDCDLVYEQYGDRYGVQSSTVFEALKSGQSPVISTMTSA